MYPIEQTSQILSSPGSGCDTSASVNFGRSIANNLNPSFQHISGGRIGTSGCQSIYGYCNMDYESYSPSSAPSFLQNSQAMNVSSGTKSTLTENAFSTSIDPCDYNSHNYRLCNGSALEIPSHEKYYRTSNISHGFAPIFYPQSATAPVIPCYSPIADCTQRNGNDYGSFGYASTFGGSSGGTPTDYFNSSNTVTPHYPSSNNYPLYGSNFNAPALVSNNTIGGTTISATNETEHLIPTCGSYERSTLDSVTGNPEDHQSSSASEVTAYSTINSSGKLGDTNCEDTASSLDNLDGNDLSFDISDPPSSNNDKELISVVEEEDLVTAVTVVDDEITSVEMKRIERCYICSRQIITVNSYSPLKVFESINDDLSGDELDITEMSDDMEIGCIEEEICNLAARRYSFSTGESVDLTRLSHLLNIKPEDLDPAKRGSKRAQYCVRCNRITHLANNLDRILHSTRKVLRRLLNLEICENNFSTGSGTTRDIESNPPKFSQGTQTDLTEPDPIYSLAECESNQDIATKSVKDTVSPHVSDNLKPVEREDSAITTDFCDNNEGSRGIFEDNCNDCEILTSETNDIVQPNLEVGQILESRNKPSKESSISNFTEFSVTSERNNNISSDMENKSGDNSQTIFAFTTNQEDNQVSTGASSIQDEPYKKKPALKKVTPNKADNTCVYCSRMFKSKGNLKTHAMICKEKLKHQSESTENMNPSITNALNPKKCTNCGIGFRSAGRLQLHLQKGCKKIVYQCPQCYINFSRMSELKVHLNTHLGVKPYKCDICQNSFTTKGNLAAHKRTHSEVKAYHCSQCQRGFHRRFALEIHMNRHNGIKPFKCSYCERQFPDPANLNHHVARNHKKKEKQKVTETKE